MQLKERWQTFFKSFLLLSNFQTLSLNQMGLWHWNGLFETIILS